MITENEFLKAELEMGISPFNPEFIALCQETIKTVEKEITFKTVLDFGCGVGAYANEFHQKGYEVVACEHFAAHREYIKQNLPHLVLVPKPITTDLMLFIEVAEHMTDKELKALFKKIQPKHILFSSTPNKTENDEAWGHINIKQQDEWNYFFDKLGYDVLKPVSFPTSWSVIYKIK